MPDDTSTQLGGSTELPPYPPTSPNDLAKLIAAAESLPIQYGPWQQFKKLYKQAEADPNASPELLGALIARIDSTKLVTHKVRPAIELGYGSGRVKWLALGQDHLCVLTDPGYRAPAAFYCYRLDPNNISKPVQMGSMQLPNGILVRMCGSQAVVMSSSSNDSTKTLTVLDCSGAAPTITAQWAENAVAITTDDRFLYVAVDSADFKGVVIWSLAPGAAPTNIGQIAIEGIGDIAVDGNHLYALSAGQSLTLRTLPKPAGLRIVDISRPSQPRMAGSANLAGGTGVAVGAGIAIVSRKRSMLQGSGVYIVDVRNPESPSEIGFVGTVNDVRVGAVVEQAAFVTNQHGGLTTIDLRDPTKPKSVSGHDPHWILAFRVRGNIAAGGNHSGVLLFNIANRFSLTPAGAPPSRKTMAYMKRRTSRFLAKLAKSNPDRFAQVAYAYLSRHHEPEVDHDIQWTAMDLLYGASDLYRHTRHGRGTYIRNSGKFAFRRPVERGHDAWLAHPELATRLLQIPDLASEVHELAYRLVLTSGAPMPPIDEALAARFLAGDSALLRSAGVRAIMTQLANPQALDPELAADLHLAGNRTVRHAVQAAVAASKKTDWRRKFADRLFAHATRHLLDARLTRREATALAFVARQLLDVAPAQKIASFSSAFLRSGNIDLVDLVLTAARKVQPGGALKWLEDAAACSEAVRTRTVAALCEAMENRAFNIQIANLLVRSTTAFVREAGWELLAASGTPDRVLRPLMQSILELRDTAPALQSLLGSSAALGLLSRAGIDIGEFMRILRDRPTLSSYLTSEALTSVTRQLPVEDVVSLIASADDDLWFRLRPGWLRNMREGLVRGSFWHAVSAKLGGEYGETLADRVIQDQELAGTFIEADDDSLLDIDSSAFEPLLIAWIQKREARFELGSALLLTGATHRNSAVRTWALARVKSLGMDIGFALRLLECELPSSFDAGREFFDAASAEQVTTYALALCDSPSASVRAFGRFYVREHWDALPHREMIRDLFEGSTPDMQAFTAALVETEAEKPAEAARFDREVLRIRSRARRAKEIVKKRQSVEHSVDITTLKALARGTVKRDAEWALAELARRAVLGEEIDGVRLDGVAGG
jgi:hypothetical protein